MRICLSQFRFSLYLRVPNLRLNHVRNGHFRLRHELLLFLVNPWTISRVTCLQELLLQSIPLTLIHTIQLLHQRTLRQQILRLIILTPLRLISRHATRLRIRNMPCRPRTLIKIPIYSLALLYPFHALVVEDLLGMGVGFFGSRVLL